MYRKYVSLVCEKNHSQKCVSVRTYKHPIIQTKWEKVFVLPPPGKGISCIDIILEFRWNLDGSGYFKIFGIWPFFEKYHWLSSDSPPVDVRRYFGAKKKRYLENWKICSFL